MQTLLGRALLVATLLFGCTPTQLEVGQNDPANPAAPPAPMPSAGAALKADFDPHADELKKSAPDPHAGHRQGGAQAAPPAASEHTGHGQKPAEADDSQGSKPAWTCPMHSDVMKSEPGNCPICGMKLKPAGGTP